MVSFDIVKHLHYFVFYYLCAVGFFANYVACRAVPPHSRVLRFANPWRQKRVPDTFFLALRIPSDQNKKDTEWYPFCFGGEGGIRTHERF